MGPTEALAQPAYELTSQMLGDQQLPLSIPLILMSLSAYGIGLGQYELTVAQAASAFAAMGQKPPV